MKFAWEKSLSGILTPDIEGKEMGVREKKREREGKREREMCESDIRAVYAFYIPLFFIVSDFHYIPSDFLLSTEIKDSWPESASFLYQPTVFRTAKDYPKDITAVVVDFLRILFPSFFFYSAASFVCSRWLLVLFSSRFPSHTSTSFASYFYFNRTF